MADLVITPADVTVSGNTTQTSIVQAEEAVAAGEVGRSNDTTKKYPKADATTESKAEASGIFISGAALDGYAVFATSGPINLGAVLTAGTAYYLSNTSGKIRPEGDISPGEFVTFLGLAETSAILNLHIIRGVAKG